MFFVSDECAFYYYDYDYCCGLLKEQGKEYVLNSDTVHKYCWGSRYEDCPHYKKHRENQSGSCYLTSACVNVKGLPDDCEELACLRRFRDTYLMNTENGEDDIKRYYDIAPKIVQKISERTDSHEWWNKIYEELILPCVEFIHSSENEKAYELYKNFSLNLAEELFIPIEVTLQLQ